MFRFSIRDVLWLTVLTALAVAWWLDHRLSQRKMDARAERIARLEEQALPAKMARLAGNVQIEILDDVVHLGSANASGEDARTIKLKAAENSRQDSNSSPVSDFDRMLKAAQDFNRGGGRSDGFGGKTPRPPPDEN